METRVQIIGVPELTRRLDAFIEKTPQAVGAALYQVALDIFADSQRLVPVDTGTLKGSGGVAGPYRNTSGNPEVMVYYGGAAADYAIFVHERLDIYHAEPTQAKFLETPFLMHVQRISLEAANAITGVIDEVAM